VNLHIVALDLSLTSTGVASVDGCSTIRRKLPERASDLQRTQRLHELTCAIDRVCRSADLVVIEGHSFNSRNTHAHSLGELHGVVKVCLLQRGIPFVIVPPSTMKKYATGKGNAPKDLVYGDAIRRGAEISNPDESDAWWLLNMAFAHYQHPHRIVMPRLNETALKAVDWPRLEEREAAVG
jgi:Holliday junction resolvasome RuvABC endonuclease subunit